MCHRIVLYTIIFMMAICCNHGWILPTDLSGDTPATEEGPNVIKLFTVVKVAVS